MVDAELLKQKMKKSSISNKADEIVKRYFAVKKPKQKGKGTKLNSNNLSIEERGFKNLKTQNSSHNDSKVSKIYEEDNINPSTVIIPFHNTQSTTFERNSECCNFNDLNLTENNVPNFTVHEEVDIKGKAIMEAGNIVTKLETLVRELNDQIVYLHDNSWSVDLIEKCNQFYKLINSQIIGTIKLTSFQYLQDSIKNVIKGESAIPKASNKKWKKNTVTKFSNYASPQPPKFMETWLSQPMYKLSAKSSRECNNIFAQNKLKDSCNSSLSKVKQKLNYEGIIDEYKANCDSQNYMTNNFNKENTESKKQKNSKSKGKKADALNK